MTRETLERTRQGTANGVPFLMRSDETESGNAKANYEFISSKRRVSKLLGGIPETFTAEIYTHGQGQDYFDRRDALKRELDIGKIDLVHPWWGGPFYVTVGRYTIKQRFSEVNKCYFTVKFDISERNSDNPETPETRLANSAGIRTLANAAMVDLQNASASAFGNNSPSNFESSIGIIDSISNSLNDTFGPLADTIQKTSEYAGKALAISEQASYYADNPFALFADTADLILGVDGLTSDVFAKFNACKNLFNFGESDSDQPIEDSSPVRIDPNPRTNEDAERATNATVMATFMQAGNTIESMAQAGAAEYDNIDQLEEIANDIDDQYRKIQDEFTKNDEAEVYQFPVPNPDYSESYESLKNVYVETQKYLEQQRLTTARVETIFVNPQPATVLSYTLYKDSTRAAQILELNGLTDNMVVSGNIKVLSQ